MTDSPFKDYRLVPPNGPIVKGVAPQVVTINLGEKEKDRTSLNRAELGMCFFHAGFKDMSRAGAVIAAIWSLIPMGGIVTRNKADRFEVTFSYVRQAGASVGRNKVEADSDDQMTWLLRKMQMLTSSFTVEISQGVLGTSSFVKMCFIKQSILALADDGHGAVLRKPNDWSAVRKEVSELPIVADKDAKDCPNQADLEIVSYLLMVNPKPKLDIVNVVDFATYHHAAYSISTSEFSSTRLGKLMLSFPKAVHSRYRFLVVHDEMGKSKVDVFRKTSVD